MDLKQISDYTQNHFGAQQARRAAHAIWETADRLKNMPNSGRIGRKPGTPEIAVVGLPFVVIYRSRSDAVEILRILHGRQRWP